MPDEFTAENVTDDLAGCRKLAGVTQGELAEAIGVSRSLIALVETGKRRLDDDKTASAVCALREAWRTRMAFKARVRAVIDEVAPFTEEDAARLRRLREERKARHG